MKKILRSILSFSKNGLPTISADYLIKNYQEFKKSGINSAYINTGSDSETLKELFGWIDAHYTIHHDAPSADLLYGRALTGGKESILAILKDASEEIPHIKNDFISILNTVKFEQCRDKFTDIIRSAYNAIKDDNNKKYEYSDLKKIVDVKEKTIDALKNYQLDTIDLKIKEGVQDLTDADKIAPLVPNIINSKNVYILMGDSGAGKSTEMCDIIKQIHNGGKVFGLEKAVDGYQNWKFLYVWADRSYGTLIDKHFRPARLDKADYINVFRHTDLPDSEVGIDLTRQDQQKLLEAHLKLKSYKFLIIDTLSSATTLNEGQSDPRLNRLMQYLIRISETYDLAVFVLHHPRKRGNRGDDVGRRLTMDDVAGGAAISRRSEEVFILNIDKDGTHDITAAKRVALMPKMIIKLNYDLVSDSDKIDIDDNIYYSLSHEEEKEHVATRDAKIMMALEAGKHTTAEISTFCQLHKKTVSRALNNLLEAGAVKTTMSRKASNCKYYSAHALIQEDVNREIESITRPYFVADSTVVQNVDPQKTFFRG